MLQNQNPYIDLMLTSPGAGAIYAKNFSGLAGSELVAT